MSEPIRPRFRITHECGKTRVYEADTGKDVTSGVSKVVFEHDASEGARLEVVFVDFAPILDVTSLADHAKRFKKAERNEPA